jgi:hypothetical protein
MAMLARRLLTGQGIALVKTDFNSSFSKLSRSQMNLKLMMMTWFR